MMGGTMWVEIEVGKGSTFHFTADFRFDPENQMTIHELMSVDAEGYRVLVIDDNRSIRATLREILSAWGMICDECAGRECAMEILEVAARYDNHYHLLFIDSEAPEIDDQEVVRKIERYSNAQDLHIVLLTPAARKGEIRNLRSLDIAASLFKPVKLTELTEVVMNIVQGDTSDSTEHCQKRSGSGAVDEETTEKGPLNILLAEDNQVNRKLALTLLNKCGYSVVTVENGQEALDAIETRPFDVVFMDIQMPVMDGFEATSRIRENEKTTGTHIPIIAMTAHAMKGDRENCLNAGMDDYVSKPVKKSDITAAVSRVLKKRAERITPRREETGTTSTKEYTMDSILEHFDGDIEFFNQIFEIFVDDYPEQLESIAVAIREGDNAVLENAAHSLKGAVANFRITHLRELAYKLEVMGREGDLTGAEETLEALKTAIHDFVEHIQQNLKTTNP
jgi:CheY-like chemotaxis protein/HPt (histidine-containing phosphotransfer) domain-containing protein